MFIWENGRLLINSWVKAKSYNIQQKGPALFKGGLDSAQLGYDMNWIIHPNFIFQNKSVTENWVYVFFETNQTDK